jgi:hypothetical protein
LQTRGIIEVEAWEAYGPAGLSRTVVLAGKVLVRLFRSDLRRQTGAGHRCIRSHKKSSFLDSSTHIRSNVSKGQLNLVVKVKFMVNRLSLRPGYSLTVNKNAA